MDVRAEADDHEACPFEYLLKSMDGGLRLEHVHAEDR